MTGKLFQLCIARFENFYSCACYTVVVLLKLHANALPSSATRGSTTADSAIFCTMHDELHWLDVPQRVQYKLCATVHRCLQHKAPQYMSDCCIHSSDIARRQHLRSAGCHQLFVPRHRRSMFGRRAFSVSGPAAWNSLPDYLRDPSRSFDSIHRDLKTFLFSFY